MKPRFITVALTLVLSSAALCTAQAPQGKLPPCDSTKFDCSCHPARPLNRSVKPKQDTPSNTTPCAACTKASDSANQQQLGPWVNALVEIQSTDQKLLLLQQENYADELKLKHERLENVEEPAQDTNQFRAETERALADDKETNDDKLTGAKIDNDGKITVATVGLMKAQGRAMQINAWGNLIGAGLSPLTSYLGRTQISTSTTMNQGSVSGGNLTSGPVSVSSNNANNSAGGAGGSNSTSVNAAGGAGGNSTNTVSSTSKGGNVTGSGNSSNSNSTSSTGGSVVGSGNSSNSNVAKGGAASNTASNANSNSNTAQGGAGGSGGTGGQGGAGGNSSSSAAGGQGGNSNATGGTGGNSSSSAAGGNAQGGNAAGGNSSSSATGGNSNAAGGNASSSAAANPTATATANPSQSQSQTASPTQSQTANPSQSQSQTH